MFQGGEAEYVGEHGQTLALREICVEFYRLSSGCSGFERVGIESVAQGQNLNGPTTESGTTLRGRSGAVMLSVMWIEERIRARHAALLLNAEQVQA
jgi:hypothetical protein